MEERFGPVLRPLYRLFKVSNFEALLKKVLWLVFVVLLLTPLVLIPLFFFFTTAI